MQRRIQVANRTQQPTPPTSSAQVSLLVLLLLLLLQVRAGQSATRVGRAVPAAMSPTSRLISPTPRHRPNHDCSLVCFWKRGKGFHLLLGKPPLTVSGARHCPAITMIGPPRDFGGILQPPSYLPYAGSGAVVTSTGARHTTYTYHTHDKGATITTTPP